MATLEKKKQTSALNTRKKQIILLDNEQLVNDAVNALRTEGGRLLHQMGCLLVVDLGNFEQKIRAALPKGAKLTTLDELDDKVLSKTELLPLRALRIRARPNFRSFTSKKANEKKQWDDIGLACDTEVSPATRDMDEVELPSRERLINKNAVAVVIVDGVQPDRKITEDERDNIIAELQEATEWISDSRPNANISWAFKIFDASVDLVPWEGVPWPGMPDAYYDGFDAIFTNSKNGRIYAFRGDDYIRFTNVSNGMDAGFPKSIASNWNGLPNAFEESIDAALWRQSNEKIYLFKGAQYVRVDPTTFTVDATYPKPIAGNWNGLPADFQAGIDAALGHKKNNDIYMFKGDKYVKFSNGSSTMDAGYPKTISSNWHGLPDDFKAGIDAAFWRDSNERIYLFKNNRWGGKYVRLNPDNFTVEPGYEGGKNIGLTGEEAESRWRDPALNQLGVESGHNGGKQLAAKLIDDTNSDYGFTVYVTKLPVVHFAYASGSRWVLSQSNLSGDISRVMAHETLHLYGAPDEYLTTSSCTSDHGRFFTAKNSNSKACDATGNDCIMRNNAADMCAFTPLHIGWDTFETKIDAAVYRGDNDKTYLFSGKYYIRYSNISDGRDEGYPKPMEGRWNGLPASFKVGIDAALWREDNKALYFFKGDQYVRFSEGSTTVDNGYPRLIKGNWKGIPVAFEGGIDAAIWRDSNDKIYMFKGSQYIRLSVINNSPTMDAGYPKSISPSWAGMSSSFNNGIDAALMRRDNGKIYLFKNAKYVRYSNPPGEGIDAGYPNWIDKNWMPFPR